MKIKEAVDHIKKEYNYIPKGYPTKAIVNNRYIDLDSLNYKEQNEYIEKFTKYSILEKSKETELYELIDNYLFNELEELLRRDNKGSSIFKVELDNGKILVSRSYGMTKTYQIPKDFIGLVRSNYDINSIVDIISLGDFYVNDLFEYRPIEDDIIPLIKFYKEYREFDDFNITLEHYINKLNNNEYKVREYNCLHDSLDELPDESKPKHLYNSYDSTYFFKDDNWYYGVQYKQFPFNPESRFCTMQLLGKCFEYTN